MKKILYIIIPILLLFPISVFATTVVCKSASITCKYDITNRTAECTYTDGKKWTARNALDKTNIEVLDEVTNTYYALKDANNNKCPEYFIVNQNNKEMFAYNYGPYTYKFDNGEVQEEQTWTIDTIRDFIIQDFNYTSDKTKSKVVKESVTMDSSQSVVTTDCNTYVMNAYTDLNTADSEFTNNGCNYGKSNSALSCETLYSNLSVKYGAANTIYNKYMNDSTCSVDSRSSLKELIYIVKIHLKDYEDATGITPTQTKAVDVSNTVDGYGDKNGCPLGEEVTKDLSGALKVMKIFAPIFVLVYTIYDAIAAIVKGDVESEGKKMLSKFLKRIAAALTLFAIPVLIDVLMQLFNIWDNTGHCSFVKTGANVQVVDVIDKR